MMNEDGKLGTDRPSVMMTVEARAVLREKVLQLELRKSRLPFFLICIVRILYSTGRHGFTRFTSKRKIKRNYLSKSVRKIEL